MGHIFSNLPGKADDGQRPVRTVIDRDKKIIIVKDMHILKPIAFDDVSHQGVIHHLRPFLIAAGGGGRRFNQLRVEVCPKDVTPVHNVTLHFDLPISIPLYSHCFGLSLFT